MIKNSAIEAAAYEIMAKAAIEIPMDYKTGLRGMLASEKGELSHFVLEAMLENY
ncbi:MAG: fumarate hydratase, partial [Alphaproteobacteria bacterium]